MKLKKLISGLCLSAGSIATLFAACVAATTSNCPGTINLDNGTSCTLIHVSGPVPTYDDVDTNASSGKTGSKDKNPGDCHYDCGSFGGQNWRLGKTPDGSTCPG